MINRLRNFLRATTFCIGFCLCFTPAASLKAQPSFFNFNYNGPTTLPVGPTCSSMLQGNVPDPVVSSTVGANIITSEFDAAASGFLYTDLFTTGNIAQVFWFVEDDQGHSHTYEYFINFVDVSPPMFDLTGIFDTLQFSSIVAVPPASNIPVTDNCTPIIQQTFVETPGPDTCQSGTFTRTWTATDANSNTAVFTQTIIIYKDSLPPQITGYPIDGSAPCEALAIAYPNWLATQIATFAATDASGIKSITNNAPVTFPPGCKVPLTVRFQAVDNCNFLQNVFVTFSTSDTQGPVVVKPPKDTVAYCSQNGNEMLKLGEWIQTKAYSQAFDTCSAPLTYSMKIGGNTVDSAQVVNAFLASFANGCSTQMVGNQSFNKVHGLISVDFFVRDACGNETFMANADFGAIDTLPPVLAGVNTTEQCGGGNDQTNLQNWINAHGNATVTEDCSDYTWTNFSFVTSTGQTGSGNFNVGPYPTVQANNCAWFTNVTFRATDDCGNSSTITLRWTIIDTQVPTFTGLEPDITVYCPNPLPILPAATVSDNCDADVTITFSRIYQDSLCDGSYTVRTTWTATDDCGNSATAIQNIFVRDTTSPVFTLIPVNQTFRCDTFLLPAVPVMGMNINASDVCSPVVSISTATNSLQNPDPAVCGHYTYNIIRTFTATDECGNTQTATQTISVVDNLGPVPGGVLDTTALCSALVPFPAPVPLATDACSGPTGAPTNTGQSITPGPCNDQYTIVVQWIAEDVCGNKTPFEQLVHVIDTVAPTLMNLPPNITVECDAIPSVPESSLFNPSDNCDNAVAVTFLETELRNPDTTSCAHWTNYILQREWTATDHCGNNRTYTQLIQIEDTTPPEIVPPADMMFPNDPDDCGALVMIPAPLSLTDVCSERLRSVRLTKTEPLVASGPGSIFTVPVASMSFPLVPPNAIPFQPVIGTPELTILLDSADAEGTTEFFNILDENGLQLGIANTETQCFSSKFNPISVNSNQLNNWLADGVITFDADPNGTGAGACNPFCGGGKMTAILDYQYAESPVPIDLTYTVDGGPSQVYPPANPVFLSVGTHTVVYTATDCVGNPTTASVQITVNDTQAPSITPPANITVFTGQNNCLGVVTLPFPVIAENCTMSAHLNLSSPVLPLQFENDLDVGIVAKDIVPTLTGLIPNAVGGGILKIRHRGDNAQPGEFFNVYDELGNQLGSTGQGTMVGECTTFWETDIPVTAAQINEWALLGGGLGFTTFFLESNRDLITYNDFVGNCAPLLPNGTDGISQIQVMLEYSYAVIDYAIKNAANQTVSTGNITGTMTRDTLPPGNYTVMYSSTDDAGLLGMATFAVTVRDTVKPKALCQPTFIVQVDPSGVTPYILAPAGINNGSTDNCTPTQNLSFSVSPSTFTCSQAGSTIPTTLTVTDSSGNSATCQTLIGVTNLPPAPSYPAVCENGTLQLFANPPSNSSYLFNWSGPNMYSNQQQNPVVSTNAMASNNGTYCVTITWAGCTSSACVVVNLAILSSTPVLTAPSGTSFCPGQNVVLTTNSYSGQNVSYQWLLDTPGGLEILGTTPTTTFVIPNPPPGTYTYYLKVFANGCNTALSNPIIVTMHPTPPADAEPEMTQVCEGFPISLMSPTPPTGGLTYQWTGPNNYSSTQQNPLVINSAIKSLHEGIYILVTQRNGCSSLPDTVMVTVNSKPAKPVLSGNLNVCTGQTVTLVCSNLLSGAQYLWTYPTASGLFDTTTSSNTLQLVNVSPANNGNITVIVAQGGCFSDASNPVQLNVQDYPSVSASSNAPICKDSLLQLSATTSSTLPLTWCWTYPGGMQNCSQNVTVPNGASGVYLVVATTSNGCSGTATVTVNNVTPPVITAINNTAPACCDGSTDAILSATVVPTPASYLWTGPAAFGTSNLPSPIIADVCTPYNGSYTLVVKDLFGCPSVPATTEINIQAPPATPNLMVSPNQPVCAGATITLTFNSSGQDTTFIWKRPNNLGDTTTTGSTLVIPNAQTWHSGNYSVIAVSTNGTCQSTPSNAVTITVNAIPATPTISSNSPVCQGSILELEGPTIPGASYIWTGPAGFFDNSEDPIRMGMTLLMAGQYKLRVVVNNCSSAVDSTLVVVVNMPNTPQIATPSMAVCMDRPPVGEFLNVLNPENGMLYTWEDAATGFILSGPSTASQLNLDSVLWLGPGTHTFRVIAETPTLAECRSPYSNVVTVKFDTIPDGINAFAGMDRFACATAPIALNATAPSGTVNGMWSQLGGPLVTIDNANLPNATFQGSAVNTYTFQWSLSNGACTNYSRDTVVITAQVPEIPDAGADSFYCTTQGIRLHATQGTFSQGKWVQSSQQANQIGIVIDDPNDPNTSISGNINPGQTYAFFWVIGNIGCGENSDDVIIYTYSPKPDAGAVQFVCDNDNCTDLSASPLESFETGQWSSHTGLSFSNPNAPNTSVCGLKPGNNIIFWTTNGGICGSQSRDTTEVYYELFPTAVNDTVTVDFGSSAEINVLDNDILPNSYTITVLTQPNPGALVANPANGVYVYRPQSGFTGTDSGMTYSVCNTNCPSACSIGTVRFQVGTPEQCFIPSIITPNADGFNDEFKIPDECTVIEGAAELDVTIFNQWGDVVFHAKPYQNDWGGTYNNEELPAGTYYYVVRLYDNDKPKTGFLLIQR